MLVVKSGSGILAIIENLCECAFSSHVCNLNVAGLSAGSHKLKLRLEFLWNCSALVRVCALAMLEPVMMATLVCPTHHNKMSQPLPDGLP